METNHSVPFQCKVDELSWKSAVSFLRWAFPNQTWTGAWCSKERSNRRRPESLDHFDLTFPHYPNYNRTMNLTQACEAIELWHEVHEFGLGIHEWEGTLQKLKKHFGWNKVIGCSVTKAVHQHHCSVTWAMRLASLDCVCAFAIFATACVHCMEATWTWLFNVRQWWKVS